MDFITGLIVGALGAVVVILFFQGAAKTENETRIYMEGFNDGQNAPRYTKAEFPLQEKE